MIANIVRSAFYALSVYALFMDIKICMLGDLTGGMIFTVLVFCGAIIAVNHVLYATQYPVKIIEEEYVFSTLIRKHCSLKVVTPILVIMFCVYGYVSGIHIHSFPEHEKGIEFIQEEYDFNGTVYRWMVAQPISVAEYYLNSADVVAHAYEVVNDDSLTDKEQDAVLAVVAEDLEDKVSVNKRDIICTAIFLFLTGCVVNTFVRRLLYVKYVKNKELKGGMKK